MEIEMPTNANVKTTRHPPWLEVTLLTGFLFCLIIGIGALITLYLLQNAPLSTTGNTPLGVMQPEHIVPPLALMELAGDPPYALATQATLAGELDTAYATALFAAELTGQQGLTIWLQLARRFLDAGRTTEAVQAFQQARSVAILDTTLNSVERNQALLQVANGLLEAGQVDEALNTAVQAKRIAEQTPELLPAQRSQIFENLRPLSQQLDNPLFIQQISELLRNPYLTSRGVALQSQWTNLGEAVPPDPNIEAAIQQRHQAARVFAERITLTGGIDIEPERQALATALLAEDQVRAESFQHTIAAGIPLAQQFQLLLQRQAWFALKARIAAGGFGVSIVPEWEADMERIRQELSAVAGNINVVLEALINSQADPITQAMLRVEVLRWLALQTELGLHPGGSPTELDERLRFAQSELERLGSPLALPVAYQMDAVPPGFRIQRLN